MDSKFLLSFQKYSISLLPIFLITGPALSDLSISLTGLAFIFSNYKKIFKLIKKNYFLLFFIIFYFYILTLSFVSENIFLSLENSLFYFRYFFFILSVNYVYKNSTNFIKLFFISFLFAFVLLILDSYFQFFYGYNILGYKYDGIRLSSFFNDEKILGSYLSRLLPIFLGICVYLFGKFKYKMIAVILMVLLIDILIILSGERSSIFYIFLSTFLITILISNWKMLRLIGFIFSIAIASLIIIYNDGVRERVVEKTINQSNIFGEKINTFSVQHHVIYSTSIKIFKDNYIFGIGPKLFREVCKKEKYKTYTQEDYSVDGCQSHPHNTYIQLLVETGILGFIFIFVLFIYLNYLLIRQFYSLYFNKIPILNDFEVCIIVSIYISLWPIVPTGSFFNNWLGVIYFLPIGLILDKFRFKKSI